jgi:outer membrane usher protein
MGGLSFSSTAIASSGASTAALALSNPGLLQALSADFDADLLGDLDQSQAIGQITTDAASIQAAIANSPRYHMLDDSLSGAIANAGKHSFIGAKIATGNPHTPPAITALLSAPEYQFFADDAPKSPPASAVQYNFAPRQASDCSDRRQQDQG